VCARIDYSVLLVLSDLPQQIANQNDAHFEPRSLRTVTLVAVRLLHLYLHSHPCSLLMVVARGRGLVH
jgi:hypothetical protein